MKDTQRFSFAFTNGNNFLKTNHFIEFLTKMDNTFEWELSKENIQPLKHGRNISLLVSALSDDHAKQPRNEQRRYGSLKFYSLV